MRLRLWLVSHCLVSAWAFAPAPAPLVQGFVVPAGLAGFGAPAAPPLLSSLAPGPAGPPSPAAAGGGPAPGPATAVAVAGSMPLPEAVTMKSWENLKGSMDKISDNVRQILFVRNDLEMMQGQMDQQEILWNSAEKMLAEENKKLDAQLHSMKSQIQADSTLEYKVRQLEATLQEIKTEEAAAKDRLDKDQVRSKAMTDTLRTHERALFGELAALNRTFFTEEQEALNRQAQVEADGEILERKVEELKERLKRLKEKALLDEEEARAKSADLSDQIKDMKQGLAGMKSKELPKWELEEKTASLRRELQQETLVILKVQQEGTQMAAACDTERTRRKEVLQKEQSMAESRLQQKDQFCNQARGQNQVLGQLLQACQYPPAAQPAQA